LDELRGWTPPKPADLFARNGYALLTELEGRAYAELMRALEGSQAAFLAATRELWDDGFPIPPDALGHFSRQWEYPYAWANLAPTTGRLLDAGSGLTFFPFVLAADGFDVVSCDADSEGLGYEERYARAGELTGLPVGYARSRLEELPFPDGSFDAVACLSVLEHVGPQRGAIVDELARVTKADGRLVATFDVALREPGELALEDAAELLASLGRHFEPAFPLDLSRPPALLTSESFRLAGRWRLPEPWRTGEEPLRSVAVLGTTWIRLPV
jgi:SAM-dependent methyltransferase